jgi:hypothetical protein
MVAILYFQLLHPLAAGAAVARQAVVFRFKRAVLVVAHLLETQVQAQPIKVAQVTRQAHHHHRGITAALMPLTWLNMVAVAVAGLVQ